MSIHVPGPTSCSGHAAPAAGGGCASHVHSFGGVRNPFRARLPEGHVLATLMDEHVRILAHLDRLEALAGELARGKGETGAAMAEIGRHLIGAEPHHKREEEVLFPALRERGVDGPPAVMEAEHVELRALKHQVADLGVRVGDGEASARQPLEEAARALVDMLRQHIHKEDNILYPMAFAAIPPGEWDSLRASCDRIGYCCR